MRGAIHTINVLEKVAGPPDSEGRGGSTLQTTVTVRGRVMAWRATQAATDVAGRFAEDTTVVAAVPLGTPVSQGDYISFTDVDPTLNGTYMVIYTQFGPNLELYCRWFGRN